MPNKFVHGGNSQFFDGQIITESAATQLTAAGGNSYTPQQVVENVESLLPTNEGYDVQNKKDRNAVIFTAKYLAGQMQTSSDGSYALWLVGDSLGVGSGAQYVGGWRTGLESALRNLRSDFNFVGSIATLSTTSEGTGLAWHSCVSGNTINDATTNLVARLALCVPRPSAVVMCLGTNNIVAGQTLTQMQTAFQSYVSTLFTNLPDTLLFVVAPPKFFAGSSVGGNLATWNALRNSYVAWLETYCNSYNNSQGSIKLVYLNPGDSLSAGTYQNDGVHFNRMGNAAFGQLIAKTLDSFMSKDGKLISKVQPSTFKKRPLCGSIILDAAGDARITAGNGLDIIAGKSYALQFDFYPTALGAGPLALFSIGPRGSQPATWFTFRQLGSSIDLGGYDGTAVYVTNTSAQDYALKINKWHRVIGILYYGGGTNSVVGLYVNGKLVGMLYNLNSNWLTSAATAYVGNSPDYVSCPGYYSNLRAWVGPSIPLPGSMQALLAVESNYYLDTPIAADSGTSTREFDGSLADDVSGNAAATLVGGVAALSPAYPGGTPLRPWETGGDYP